MISKQHAKRLYTAMVQRSQTQGSTISTEWLTFENFYEWLLTNYVEGWHLDKDLTQLGNKIYHPDLCAYVPGYVNHLLSDSAASRGECPLGVWKGRTTNKGEPRYEAACRLHGKQYKLGTHLTIESAHRAWQIAKAKSILETTLLYQCEKTHSSAVVSSLLSVRDKLLASANEGNTTLSYY